MKHVNLLLFFCLCLASFVGAHAVSPNLQARGENFEVRPLEKGRCPFINRDNMFFGDIPEEYAGWMYTQINANSTWMPGPKVNLSVCADSDGFIYAMVSNKALPDLCAEWAETNGWSLVAGQSLVYGSREEEVFSFYRKLVGNGEWIEIVQPETFSGAIIIAPSIRKEGEVILDAPKLEAKGENFNILPLEKGQRPFINRTNMSLSDVPADYAGWQFTQINANSTWMPGPKVSLSVKADAEGFIYAMVSNIALPDVCKEWADANGWSLIDGQNLVYGSKAEEVFSFYRKSVSPNEWIDVVQPETFSGALIVAPSISVDYEAFDAVPVDVESMGTMEVGNLKNGELAYSNRTYVFSNVDKGANGLEFTRLAGGTGTSHVLNVTSKADGDMYIAVTSDEGAVYDPLKEGWEKVEGQSFNYNDPNNTEFSVFKRNVRKGEMIRIWETCWQGVLVLSSDIEYKVMTVFDNPPGVVIHNSPAATKHFIGSPSIIKCKDGHYLASHDYFGDNSSRKAFVYRSDDQGKTWNCISEIDGLFWASLLEKEDGIYLIGVMAVGTGTYGNAVVLKSVDGGVSWTKPVDSKSGLLLSGNYHCAPVPIVYHDGRIWRAMEEHATRDGWGKFRAFMMSIDEDADMLDASNWTFSNHLDFPSGAGVYGNAWLEGNAVVAPDGTIKDVLRVNYDKDNKAAIIDISADGKTASFDVNTGFVDLPGACKKFTIRYDSVSNRYWTLSNYVLKESLEQSSNVERIRNTLVLSWSDDLRTWHIKDTLLHHPDVANHAFQYLDWIIEDEDIIAVSRTAWEDSTGNADSQHNANYITFHRFRNFRSDKHQSQSSTAISRWPGGRTSAVALTFDGGLECQLAEAVPSLEACGLRSTFFVSSSLAGSDGRMSWDDMLALKSAGHEIGSNSLSGISYDRMTYNEVESSMSGDAGEIGRRMATPCIAHSYPTAYSDEIVAELASRYFMGVLDHSSEKIQTSAEFMSVPSYRPTFSAERTASSEDEALRSLTTAIGNLDVSMLAVNIGNVLPLSSIAEGDTVSASKEFVDGLCRFLSESSADGSLYVSTFSDLVRYSLEREASYVVCDSLSDGSLLYDIQMDLDTCRFNMPLTVACKVPEDWNTVSCIILDCNGDTLRTSVVSPQNGLVLVDALPEREKIVLSCETSIGINAIDDNIKAYIDNTSDCLVVEGDFSDGATCVLYGISGMKCFSFSVPVGACRFSCSVKHLPSGVYVLDMKNKKVNVGLRTKVFRL